LTHCKKLHERGVSIALRNFRRQAGMAANSSNPFLDSVNAWGERSMAFLNSMLREPAASPFLSPSMTGFMPPGMNFPGMPSATPHWNPFGNLNSPPTSAGMDWMGQAQQFY